MNGETKKKYSRIIPVFFIALFLLSLQLGAAAFYFFRKSRQAENLLYQNPMVLGTSNQDLIKKVGRLYSLPRDEEPQIAEVTDASKMEKQAFLKKAKNGDMILLYHRAKIAILYDPNADKILQIGPLAGPSPAATPDVSASISISPVSDNLKVAIYNGTENAGKTTQAETLLKDRFLKMDIVETDFAKKRDYKANLVIDISGGNENEVRELAKILSASLSQLPEGESRPGNADALIIIGSDFK